jgi:hypothetical protein
MLAAQVHTLETVTVSSVRQDGTVWNQRAKQECPIGKYSVAGSTECTVCPIGTSCPNVGMSMGTSCAKGRYGDREGVTECTECQAGRYTDKVGQIACRGCSAGKYCASNGSDSESGCVDCAKGKYSYLPASAGCAECPKDTYTDVVGKSTCTECPIGKTTIGATETATGASSCIKSVHPCRPGQMRHESGQCTNCTWGITQRLGSRVGHVMQASSTISRDSRTVRIVLRGVLPQARLPVCLRVSAALCVPSVGTAREKGQRDAMTATLVHIALEQDLMLPQSARRVGILTRRVAKSASRARLVVTRTRQALQSASCAPPAGTAI